MALIQGINPSINRGISDVSSLNEMKHESVLTVLFLLMTTLEYGHVDVKSDFFLISNHLVTSRDPA